MKIAILTQAFPFAGEYFMRLEALEIEARYKYVTWFPRSASGTTQAKLSNVEPPTTQHFVAKVLSAIRFFPIRAFWSEIATLRHLRPVDFLIAARDLTLAAFDVGLRVSRIVGLGRFDVIYSFWSSIDGLAAVQAARHMGGKSIVRCHGSDFYKNKNGVPPPFTSYLHSNERPDLFVYLAAKAKAYAVSNFGDVPSETSKLGIDVTAIPRALPRATREAAGLTLVTCSSAAPVKRLDLIARVFGQLRENGVVEKWVHFGASKSEFLHGASLTPADADGIEVRGFLANGQLLEELGQIKDGFFLNLSVSEGTPVSLLEAMAAGIPVAAGDVGNISEIVEPDCGLLIRTEAWREIASEIEGWLRSEDKFVQAANAANRIRTEFDSRETTSHFLSLLSQLGSPR